MRVHPTLWKAVLQRDNWICQYCDTDMLTSRLTFEAATVDHLIPVSAGGADDESNLVASCSGCNQRLSRCPFTTFTERKAYLEPRLHSVQATWLEWRAAFRPEAT